MIKIILILPMILMFSACTEMNSKFDCPMKSGIRCESIDSINARIDRGEIGNTKAKIISVNSLQVVPIATSLNLQNGSYPAKAKPLRYAETVQRVWIAPFEDKEGNYHQESDIYTVVKPGSWIGAPLKEINIDGE